MPESACPIPPPSPNEEHGKISSSDRPTQWDHETIKSLAVLVLDDSPTEQSTIVNHLHHLGFTDIDVAEDGLHALEHLRRKQYGLLISGIKMPVIMFTAKTNLSTSWLAGAIAYVAKPFTEGDFEKAVTKVLGSSQRNQDFQTKSHSAV